MSIDNLYVKAGRLAKALRIDLEEHLRKTLGSVGDPFLVRAHFERSRIKDQKSLERKAEMKGWTLEEAITKTWDFVGFRIVCNNLQDVERTAQLLQEKLEADGLDVKRKDYVSNPRNSGYRAVHLVFKAAVTLASESMTLGCEIQIRTYLQDAWGHLSHMDIYKDQVPKYLSDQMKMLANSLARADTIAERIRREVVRPRKGRKPAEGAFLTRSSIAFIYHRAFNEDPPDYVVESTLREFGSTPIRADGLDQILQDKDLLRRLIDSYQESAHWAPPPEQVFRWAVDAAVNGTSSALRLASREGRIEWNEVDRQYKSELSSSVPVSLKEFAIVLRDGAGDGDAAWDVNRWAEYFDAGFKCDFCGSELVDIDALADRLIKHFGLKGRKAIETYDEVREGLLASGVEESDGSSLCDACRYRMNKDD